MTIRKASWVYARLSGPDLEPVGVALAVFTSAVIVYLLIRTMLNAVMQG